MSDIFLPITGKDVQISVTVDGVLKLVSDQVTRFTRRQVQDEIITKNLGTDGSKIDKVFSHWEGTIEFATQSPDLDEICDLQAEARRLRVPILINLYEPIHYRDSSSKRYTYVDIKADWEASVARSEAATITLNWKSGEHRIAG